MTELELKQLIDQLLTRVGSDRISGTDLRQVLKEMVDYTSDNIVSGAGGGGTIAEWEPDPTSYDTGDLVINNDRIWKSKTDGNVDNEPPQDSGVTEDTYWIEVSKSINLADWSPGIIGSGLFITIYNDNFYKLVNATRPYETTNIVTEIAAGDWRPIGSYDINEATGATYNLKIGEAYIFEGTSNAAATLPEGNDAIIGVKFPVYNETANDSVTLTVQTTGGQTIKYPTLYKGQFREYMWTGTKWI
jgi:hypothetical protein